MQAASDEKIVRPTITLELSMTQSSLYEVEVMFGDCDPAGIVFFPNFGKWMDASSSHFFRTRGVPPWRELFKTRGIVGTPVLETHTRFKHSATYGERLQVHTCILEWHDKVFVHRHQIFCDGEMLCEGTEKRVFVVQAPDRKGGIMAIPIPPDIKALCCGEASVDHLP